jgi:hypothetical protein
MEISAEQFKALVQSASRQSSDRRNERRGAARIGVRYLATVRPIIPGINAAATPFQVWLRDISGIGIGIASPVAMVGRFTLELENSDGIVQATTCKVLSCRPVGEDSFQVGAAFADAVSFEVA